MSDTAPAPTPPPPPPPPPAPAKTPGAGGGAGGGTGGSGAPASGDGTSGGAGGGGGRRAGGTKKPEGLDIGRFRDEAREFVFVEGLRHGEPSTGPRVRNFPEDTQTPLFREMVESALPVDQLDILDAWLSPMKLGCVLLRCCMGVAEGLHRNRFDLGLLGIWSLRPREAKPGAPVNHDISGHFAIDPEFLMEAHIGHSAAAGVAAQPPRPRVARGSAEFRSRRDEFMLMFKAELRGIGLAVVTIPFLPGQESQTEGPFFPLAGPVEMAPLRKAVSERPARCPTFAHITLQQTLAAASAVPVSGGKVHALQLQAHLTHGDRRSFPIDPQSFVDQIMRDPTASALNPVCLGDRSQLGAAFDLAPWGAQSMVLSMPGLEPDGCQVLAALDKISFVSPDGIAIKLAWGAAISDSSGLRRRLNRWWEDGKRANGGKQLPTENSAGFATPVRGLFLDANGVTQRRLRQEFGEEGLLDLDGSVRRRTGGQGTLTFAPTTPPGKPGSGGHPFGRTYSSRFTRKKSGRRGYGSSDGSSGSDSAAGHRPRRRGRRLAADFAQGGSGGAGGQGDDEIVIDLCMSEDALALLPPGSQGGQMASSKLTVSRGQGEAIQGMMQMMNSCVATILTAQNSALQASESRQQQRLTDAVEQMKVHTDAQIETAASAIRKASGIDESAAAEHAAALKELRAEELAAAGRARTRALEAEKEATADDEAVKTARDRAKARADRLAREEDEADREAAEHQEVLRAARLEEKNRLERRALREQEEDLASERGRGAPSDSPSATPSKRRLIRRRPHTPASQRADRGSQGGSGSESQHSDREAGAAGLRGSRAARAAARRPADPAE